MRNTEIKENTSNNHELYKVSSPPLRLIKIRIPGKVLKVKAMDPSR
jgi:hypothetical protein